MLIVTLEECRADRGGFIDGVRGFLIALRSYSQGHGWYLHRKHLVYFMALRPKINDALIGQFRQRSLTRFFMFLASQFSDVDQTTAVACFVYRATIYEAVPP